MHTEAKVDALQWEVIQRPDSLDNWLDLIRAVGASSSYKCPIARANAVNTVYERALRSIPANERLWTAYIESRKGEAALCSINELFMIVRELYERAVSDLPLCVSLWCAFLDYILSFSVVRLTMTRCIAGRALASLPVEHHYQIWKRLKLWTTSPHVPDETFRVVWRLYLLSDPTTSRRREYFALLLGRGNRNMYLEECIAYAAERGYSDALLREPDFWEQAQMVLQSRGWTFTGSSAALSHLIEAGKTYSASPVELVLSFVVFLYGQGSISEGRAAMKNLLQTASDPDSFSMAYSTAVELEDQVYESFALSEAVQRCSDEEYNTITACMFGIHAADPRGYMRELVEDYALLMNQAQLRNSPHHVPLWLKRVELLRERVFTQRATADDIVSLFRQAIAQCTTGLAVVEAAAAELFSGLASALLHMRDVGGAINVLATGAWSTTFSSTSANMMLLGNLVEVKLMTSNAPEDVFQYLFTRLATLPTAATKRGRGGLLVGQHPQPHVVLCPEAWVLCFDLCCCYGTEDELSRLLSAHSASYAYTAEAACYMARRLVDSGRCDAASKEIDKCLSSSVTAAEPAARVFVLTQSMAFLCRTYGPALPLSRLREVCRLSLEAAAVSIAVAPAATVELLVACAALEGRVGLCGEATQTLQRAALLAIAVAPEQVALVLGLMEQAVRYTHEHRGIAGTRQFCGTLLARLRAPQLIHRIALHWAALERRCGNPAQAHAVLDACGDSQDPASLTGSTYWTLWESMCMDINEFKTVARRKQQVTVRFGGDDVGSEDVN